MKKHILFAIIFSFITLTTFAQNRFPKPDFESGYVYPEQQYVVPNEVLWSYIDIAALVLLMGFVAWAVIKKQVRLPVTLVSVASVAYFGFFRHGCVCSIGAVQNVALALADDSYTIPLYALLMFLLPVVFTLFFGRVFCGGACPFGALQDLVNIKNYKLSKTVTGVLSVFPWIYLGFAVLFAVTNSRFIICRFDPFVGIFRMGGELPMILFGVLLLIFSVFTGRPFCRFICPYGVILRFFSKVSFFKIKITKKECINCQLCHNACPVDAIRPPYENKVKENRTKGVRRILIYAIILPVMAFAGAFVTLSLSDTLSRVNNDVQLYEMIETALKNPHETPPVEVQTFYMQGGEIEELGQRAVVMKIRFDNYSIILGAFLGLIIGITLIKLSTKRIRKHYEIDDANCVSCGRCFKYCPQNQKLKEKVIA